MSLMLHGVRRVVPLLQIGLLIAAHASCAEPPAPPPPPPPRAVEVLDLQASEVREIGEYLGSLSTRERVNVMPQVAGYVRKVHAQPGQRVEAGAPLIEIDAREEKAAVASAKAQVQSVRAQLAQARRAQKRVKALHEEGLATGEEVDQVQAQVEVALAALRAARSQVSQRDVQLDYHVVRAPVPGAVGDVLVRLGELVSTTTLVTSVAQSDDLELSIGIPAARARELEIGKTPVEILGEDSQVSVTSHVFFIAPEADARTQLVEIKAAFANEGRLRPRELVRARVIYSTHEALQIPALAVVRQSGQPFAYVLSSADGRDVVERRPIQLGPLGEQAYVVRAGLAAGDRIAVSSIQMLSDGAPVQVKPPTITAAEGPALRRRSIATSQRGGARPPARP